MTARPITQGLILAALMLVAAAAIKYAQSIHVLGAEGSTRAIQVVMGLSLAYLANFMPKRTARRNPTASAGRAQSALRVGGMAFMLAGLAYAAIGAFAPLDAGFTYSIAVIAAAMIVSIGYAIWASATCQRVSRSEAPQ